MTLASGTRLGPYEIVGKLGEGGMGEVYRARDTRLDRDVAVKVVASRFLGDAALRTRFLHEARTISALQHPRICTLYDVGEEGGHDFLVMEYLAGESLAGRLARGPLEIDEALETGRQIAEALHAAHRQGIVHRDLKPANVMLTASGVKLLDFGLAKLRGALSAGPQPDAVSLAVTEAGPPPALTRAGTTVGTPQYMAPEQLEGREADERSDIWAIGCVLYEMVTGQRPFDGGSHASLVGAIMRAEPAGARTLRPEMQPDLERLILSCLAKDPERRWQSAHDIGLQLATIARVEPAQAPAGPAPRRFSPWAGLAALGAGLALIAAALWSGAGPETPAAPEVRFEIAAPAGTTFPATVENSPFAVSPDGSLIAFVGYGPGADQRIWIRPVAGAEARALPGSEGARSLFWSPDGRSLGFFAADKLKRLEVTGGGALPLCDVQPAMGYQGSWGSRGDILFAPVQGYSIQRVSDAGGTVSTVIEPDTTRQETRTVWPQYLPDGKSFLYLRLMKDGTSSLMRLDPGNAPVEIGPLVSRFELTRGPTLVFAKEGVLLGQRFDVAASRLTGPLLPVAPHVGYFLSSAWAGFSASPGGTLVFQTAQDRLRIAWYDRRGKPLETIATPGPILDARISPEGRMILFDRRRADLGTYDLWLFDLERGVETRITSDPGSEFGGVFIPGGRSFFYSASVGESPQLMRSDLATAERVSVVPRRAFQAADDVSRDGRRLLFSERGSDGLWRLWTLDLSAGAEPRPLPPAPARQFRGRFSPDGNYLAFLSTESGRAEAYVASMAQPEDKTRISATGASLLDWSGTGDEILYLTPDGRMMSVPARTEPRLSLGEPVELFTLPAGTSWTDFDLSPDGRRILAVESESRADMQPLSAIVNWSPKSGS